MRLAYITVTLLSVAAHLGAENILAFAGTYTRTASKGIYSFHFDTSTGAMSNLRLAAETPNPSFLAMDRNARYLYAVNEIGDFGREKSGSVSAFSVEAGAGTLKMLDIVASRGEAPAHLALDPSGKWLVAANYTGGSLALFSISTGGALEAVDFVQRTGSSVHARQKSPHPHQIFFESPASFKVTDLGTDELLSFKIVDGKLSLSGSVREEPGSGPRHAAIDRGGRFAYVLNELDSSISVRALPGLDEKQKLSLLPEAFRGRNTSAEIAIHPNGALLFASNRGLDEIVTFAIAADGKLTPAGNYPAQGKTPRNFVIDPSGKYLLVANQDSDSIVAFRIDQHTGMLSDTGLRLTVPMPVCLIFSEKRQ
jgi:6-phosphogluconolactonase